MPAPCALSSTGLPGEGELRGAESLHITEPRPVDVAVDVDRDDVVKSFLDTLQDPGQRL